MKTDKEKARKGKRNARALTGMAMFQWWPLRIPRNTLRKATCGGVSGHASAHISTLSSAHRSTLSSAHRSTRAID
eukprot:166296-Rhodomonas_salina.1